MKKRAYELMILVDPDASEDKVFASVETLLKEHQFGVDDKDVWGLRTLAYPINKKTQGRYCVYQLKSEEDASIDELVRELTIKDAIMRHCLVRKGG